MRLGIDLDGVVANFNAGWIRLYNEEFGASLEVSQVGRWDGIYELTDFPSMSEFWRWARGTDRQSIFRYLDTFPGAVETLRDLSRDHKIVIITTKPGWAVHDTFAWIAEHRIPTREVHMTPHKWEVDVDMYLDDSPTQLPRLLRHRPDRIVCRYVRPWNEPLDGAHDIHNWDEFSALVSEIVLKSL